jgi:WD40 repeat protein
VVAWDLTGGRGLARTFTIAEPGAPAVTPAGSRFVVPTRNAVEVFDSRTLARNRIETPGGKPSGVAIASDARTLAVVLGAGIGLFDLRTGVPIRPFGPLHMDTDWSPLPSFSRDGRWLAYVGASTVVSVWDVRRRADAAVFSFDDPSVTAGPGITAAEISPSGRDLALSVEDDAGHGTLEVMTAPSLRVTHRVRMPVGHWLGFARDGRSLLYGDDQGSIWRLDTHTWQPRKVPLSGPAGAIVDADVSPDGRTLATAGGDGTVRLWDLPSGRAIGTPLPGPAGQTASVRFVRSGAGLLALYEGGRGFVWDLRASAWARRACAVAGRTLTRAEWADALPGQPYKPACA